MYLKKCYKLYDIAFLQHRLLTRETRKFGNISLKEIVEGRIEKRIKFLVGEIKEFCIIQKV